MNYTRASGILLHVSSLPGADGIGDLGKPAFAFIDFLIATKTKYWQVLPLNPTGYGNSPYQGLSACAGNPLFIALDNLIPLGLLNQDDLAQRPSFRRTKIDYAQVIPWKMEKLQRAYLNFKKNHPSELVNSFHKFCQKNKSWLDNYALFMTIKNQQQLHSWDCWPHELRFRDSIALKKFQKEQKELIEEQKFQQFLFFDQWRKIKTYANEHGVQIIGDIPIFVGYDCADTWANSDLFFFDEELKPTVVAGVPPDFFSRTGQLWGNPLYDWKKHKTTGYAWWIERIQQTLNMVDIIRLDHFRGFAGYYEIPAGSKTAEHGKWVKGPGKDFFDALYQYFGDLPFIAEDLGVITPDVIALRERYHLPGMKILQFGFNPNPEKGFMPHHIEKNFVAYTGTHDNSTTRGWFHSIPKTAQENFKKYTGNSKESIPQAMIRLLWQTVALFAITPMQDLLELGDEARMNFPGKLGGNWEWKMHQNWNSPKLEKRLLEINQLYDRSGDFRS